MTSTQASNPLVSGVGGVAPAEEAALGEGQDQVVAGTDQVPEGVGAASQYAADQRGDLAAQIANPPSGGQGVAALFGAPPTAAAPRISGLETARDFETFILNTPNLGPEDIAALLRSVPNFLAEAARDEVSADEEAEGVNSFVSEGLYNLWSSHREAVSEQLEIMIKAVAAGELEVRYLEVLAANYGEMFVPHLPLLIWLSKQSEDIDRVLEKISFASSNVLTEKDIPPLLRLAQMGRKGAGCLLLSRQGLVGGRVSPPFLKKGHVPSLISAAKGNEPIEGLLALLAGRCGTDWFRRKDIPALLALAVTPEGRNVGKVIKMLAQGDDLSLFEKGDIPVLLNAAGENEFLMSALLLLMIKRRDLFDEESARHPLIFEGMIAAAAGNEFVRETPKILEWIAYRAMATPEVFTQDHVLRFIQGFLTKGLFVGALGRLAILRKDLFREDHVDELLGYANDIRVLMLLKSLAFGSRDMAEKIFPALLEMAVNMGESAPGRDEIFLVLGNMLTAMPKIALRTMLLSDIIRSNETLPVWFLNEWAQVCFAPVPWWMEDLGIRGHSHPFRAYSYRPSDFVLKDPLIGKRAKTNRS